MRENKLELHGVCKKYTAALRSAMWDLPCREAR